MDQFAERRKRLLEKIGDGAIIVSAGRLSTRSHDVDYVFRQPSPFWYLMGFEEPEALAVLRPGQPEQYVLFVQPRDPKLEVWTGLRAGVEGAGRGPGVAWVTQHGRTSGAGRVRSFRETDWPV